MMGESSEARQMTTKDTCGNISVTPSSFYAFQRITKTGGNKGKESKKRNTIKRVIILHKKQDCLYWLVCHLSTK